MPRGRKGPPQESIDSILLAISRRDDIDPEMLSHYFDRLDEEWTSGARERVLHLLRSSDQTAHSAAVFILSELATDFDLEELEDFVTDPTVSDLAKLSLAPILKELGSEMADEGIIEYLNDPSTAIRQMQMRLLELVDESEMGVESILGDVIAMPLERRLAFINWLGSSNDPRAASLLIPLLDNQSSRVVAAIIEAFEQLGSVAIQQSIPALKQLIATSSSRNLRQQARAALGRITMQAGLDIEEQAPLESSRSSLPPHEARVSFIDGSGSQLIMLSWERPDGLLKGVNMLYQDQWGIKDCYGLDEIEKERWDELVQDLEKQGFVSFQLPFAEVRALALEARALNKRLRHKLPIAYSIWRPFIEAAYGDDTERKQKRAPSHQPGPAALDEKTLALAQRGDELYNIMEFASWLYEPMEGIEPYIARYMAMGNIFTIQPASSRARTQKGKQKERAQRAQKAYLEVLVGEAFASGDLMDTKWRLLYTTRLQRQAALFSSAGREEEAALINAVAAVLHPESGVPLQEQAFPRAMLRLSIEQGPLRLMLATLGHGESGKLPINLFDEE